MQNQSGYRIVKLASGAYSVHSLADGETFHPVIGPVAEAQALYVKQLNLLDRVRNDRGPFVIWDIGLGAAANPLAVLNALNNVSVQLQILSFDQTGEPLAFALQHTDRLRYLRGYENHLDKLLGRRSTNFSIGPLAVEWNLHLADFPRLLQSAAAERWPRPHAILFDAYSPARNPAMWTQPLFARIYQLLDPNVPCAMPTYSRSTMLRVSLLLAGFFVGAGHATGEKEETTIAANRLELISEPVDRKWLNRARQSTSAEPLWEPVYRQAPISAETLAKLEAHPQFA